MMNDIEQLRETLDALRTAHVAQAEVRMEGLVLKVVFTPDLSELTKPGAAPLPGAWKGPQGLDESFRDPGELP